MRVKLSEKILLILSVLLAGLCVLHDANAASTDGVKVNEIAEASPALLTPFGTIHIGTPFYSWIAAKGVTAYVLRVQNSQTQADAFVAEYTPAEVGCASGSGICSTTPSDLLGKGSYIWRVQPKGPVDPGFWNSVLYFNVEPDGQKITDRDGIVIEIDPSGDGKKIPLPQYAGSPSFGNILRAWAVFSDERIRTNPTPGLSPQYESVFLWAKNIVEQEQLTKDSVENRIDAHRYFSENEKTYLKAALSWHPNKEKADVREKWITAGWGNSVTVPKNAARPLHGIFTFGVIHCSTIFIVTDKGVVVEHFVPQYMYTLNRIPKTLIALKRLGNIKDANIFIIGQTEFFHSLYAQELANQIQSAFPKVRLKAFKHIKPLSSIYNIMYLPKENQFLFFGGISYDMTVTQHTIHKWWVVPDIGEKSFLAKLDFKPVQLKRLE